MLHTQFDTVYLIVNYHIKILFFLNRRAWYGKCLYLYMLFWIIMKALWNVLFRNGAWTHLNRHLASIKRRTHSDTNYIFSQFDLSIRWLEIVVILSYLVRSYRYIHIPILGYRSIVKEYRILVVCHHSVNPSLSSSEFISSWKEIRKKV